MNSENRSSMRRVSCFLDLKMLIYLFYLAQTKSAFLYF